MNEFSKPRPAGGTPVPPTRIDFTAQDRAWIADRISEVLADGRLTLGPYGERFEREFASLVGARHAIATNSGTSSLEISLRVMDVTGKDVLVPADTFFATAAAVVAAGGHPVLMDSDPATMSTTAEEVERRITPRTAGIIIVHIAGFVTGEMPEIMRVANEKELWVVEDAAHAHAATLNGRHAGTFGIAGSFSFYPTKVMTSAEGGMIVTDDEDLADEARIYRDQGKPGFLQNRHVRMGSNWRMSEPHAIIGLRHLSRLADMVAARRRIAARFDKALASEDLPVTAIAEPRGCTANYYKYPVMLGDGIDREAFKAYLKEAHGVSCSGEVYEAPLHRHPVFAGLDSGDLPKSEYLCSRHVCLPIFAGMTEEEAERTIDALRDAGRRFR